MYSINQAKILPFSYNTDIYASRHEDYPSIPIHSHDFMELELIVRGKGTNVCNGIPIPIARGSLYLLTTSDFHRLISDEPLTIYNVSFREKLLSESLLAEIYNGEKNHFRSEIDGEMLATAIKLFEILEQQNNAPEGDTLLRIRINLLEAIIGILLLHAKPVEQQVDGSSSRLLRILIHLHRSFAENPRLSDMAASVGLTPSYVSKKFKEQFGIPYIEYLTRLKINYAKTLLITCDKPITEICYTCGFNSLSNFMSIFKKQVGMPPMQYRSAHSKKQKIE